MKYQRLSYDPDYAHQEADGGYECAIKCPKCGEAISSLHHETVKVFNRDSEDKVTGLYTEIRGTKVETRRCLPAGNPSSRRGGVVINFSCEQCGPNVGNLCVAQHKGSTFLYWELDA
jgi:hypothetical protein